MVVIGVLELVGIYGHERARRFLIFLINYMLVPTQTIAQILKLFPSVLKIGAPLGSQDHLRMKFKYSFIGPRKASISSLNNAEN